MLLDPYMEAVEILLDAQAILEARGRWVGDGEQWDGPLSLMSAVAIAQSQRKEHIDRTTNELRISFRADTFSSKAVFEAAMLEHGVTPNEVNDSVFDDPFDEDDNEDVLGLLDHAISILQDWYDQGGIHAKTGKLA